MDTIAKLKAELFAELNVQYRNLIESVRKMPLNEQFKNYGFQNLDQGIMWVHKAIELLQAQTALPENNQDIKKGDALLDGKLEEKPETLN